MNFIFIVLSFKRLSFLSCSLLVLFPILAGKGPVEQKESIYV